MINERNIKLRSLITKLRVSNHDLAVETGRYSDTARNKRVCCLCNNGIEDEIHFLFECSELTDQQKRRDDLISYNFTNYRLLSCFDKFFYMLQNEKATHILGTYLFVAFDARNILQGRGI